MTEYWKREGYDEGLKNCRSGLRVVGKIARTLREFWASTLFSFPHQTTVASHAAIPVASHTFGNRVGVLTVLRGHLLCNASLRV